LYGQTVQLPLRIAAHRILSWSFGIAQGKWHVLLQARQLVTYCPCRIRKCLEATIQGLQPQIAEGMNQLNTIKQEREIVKII
jgi:hypothetical protein